jgi:uncharacterized membrane protein
VTDRLPRLAVGVLALAGVGVAAYLTWVHYSPEQLVCFAGGGCETVQRSSYSELGPVPVAVLGLAAYVVLLGTALVRGVLAAAASVAVALGGLAFAVWLVYVQGWILDAWCVWCVTSDVVLTLLTAAAVWRLLALAED